jgi:hypothetical protein
MGVSNRASARDERVWSLNKEGVQRHDAGQAAGGAELFERDECLCLNGASVLDGEHVRDGIGGEQRRRRVLFGGTPRTGLDESHQQLDQFGKLRLVTAGQIVNAVGNGLAGRSLGQTDDDVLISHDVLQSQRADCGSERVADGSIGRPQDDRRIRRDAGERERVGFESDGNRRKIGNELQKIGQRRARRFNSRQRVGEAGRHIHLARRRALGGRAGRGGIEGRNWTFTLGLRVGGRAQGVFLAAADQKVKLCERIVAVGRLWHVRPVWLVVEAEWIVPARHRQSLRLR